MKLTITKVEFLNQLAGLGRRFEKAEVIEQCGDDWDHLTGGANSATLWIRVLLEPVGLCNVKCQSMTIPKGLIRDRNSANMREQVFYLGNVCSKHFFGVFQ